MQTNKQSVTSLKCMWQAEVSSPSREGVGGWESLSSFPGPPPRRCLFSGPFSNPETAPEICQVLDSASLTPASGMNEDK